MKTHARVAVIGGGIGGCSTLYHLTREGWSDVVLVERDELTSGTTWHSAAQCPNLAPNQLLILLRSYTIGLYRELSADPEYPINYHYATGGLRLITDPDNLDACHHIISVARGVGVDFELISAHEVISRHPLLTSSDLLAALWDPLDGDIDPAQLCQALARLARKAGAEIYRHNPVTGLTQKPNSEWVVHTQNGDIVCEHVVVAAGYRANEVGAMMGHTYPVISMEHMYFITGPIPDLEARDTRVPMVRCPRDTFYMRQEKNGLLVGVYEEDCRTFGVDGIDPDFTSMLCPNDLDRCLPKLEAIFDRVPCLREAGIQSMVTGPIPYSADAGPLVGKQPGLRNVWSMNGLRVGIGEGGGYGKMLAQMIVQGETEWDTWQLDPRRITGHATTSYTIAKAVEDYRNEFRWHMPGEHRPAGRPAKTTPLYPLLKANGAQFSVINGWERATFYKPDPGFSETYSYRFPNWHRVVGSEVRSLCTGVGIAEISGFNRYEISGTDAMGWLDSLTCSRLPGRGRVGLCYFLTQSGNILGEATIVQLDENRVWYGSAATAEYHDMDWLQEHLPKNLDIRIRSLTNTHTTLILAGPKARALLLAASPCSNWSQEGFPWMTAGLHRVGTTRAVVMAVSFSGEQAFEIHVPNHRLSHTYELLTGLGAAHGLVHFGMYAIQSMRLEKGYGHWKEDLITEFNPMEAGLGRFVDLNKEFPGKAGLQQQVHKGNRKERVLLIVHGNEAPAHHGETVLCQGHPVGTITSAAWGYRTGKNIAMAYIDPLQARTGTELEISLLGKHTKAVVGPPCVYDPNNTIPRGRQVHDEWSE